MEFQRMYSKIKKYCYYVNVMYFRNGIAFNLEYGFVFDVYFVSRWGGCDHIYIQFPHFPWCMIHTNILFWTGRPHMYVLFPIRRNHILYMFGFLAMGSTHVCWFSGLLENTLICSIFPGGPGNHTYSCHFPVPGKPAWKAFHKPRGIHIFVFPWSS